MQADYTPTPISLGTPPTSPIPRTPRITPRRAALVLASACALAALCLPFDLAIARFTTRFGDTGDLRLGGDLRRTLLYLQQFGDLASSALIGIAILLLDPAQKRRFADWIAGAGLTWAAVSIIKVLAGRPRPGIVLEAPRGYDSALAFAGAWRRFPLPRLDHGQPAQLWAYSWELGKGIAADLWSMPSSHSSAAAALAVVLARLYPRLTPLVASLALITAAARIIFTAHFPSDVIIGLAIGYTLTAAAMDHQWGSRLLHRTRPA